MTLLPSEATQVQSAMHVTGSLAAAVPPITLIIPLGNDSVPASETSLSVNTSAPPIPTDVTYEAQDPVSAGGATLPPATLVLDTSAPSSTDVASESQPVPAGSATPSPSTPAQQALTTLHHLPVTTVTVGGEVRFQQTHSDFPFDVLRAGAIGPFYLITCGHRVGVFSTW